MSAVVRYGAPLTFGLIELPLIGPVVRRRRRRRCEAKRILSACDVSVWVFHGAKDATVPVSRSR